MTVRKALSEGVAVLAVGLILWGIFTVSFGMNDWAKPMQFSGDALFIETRVTACVDGANLTGDAETRLAFPSLGPARRAIRGSIEASEVDRSGHHLSGLHDSMSK
jgi:hypothetical protein